MKNLRHPAFYPYMFAIDLLGIAIIALCAIRLSDGSTSFQWIILASLTVLTGSFTVKIPGIHSKISVADTFVFTNIILFGPAAGAITAALDGLMGSVRMSPSTRRLGYMLFNMTAMALSAFAGAEVFFGLLGR